MPSFPAGLPALICICVGTLAGSLQARASERQQVPSSASMEVLGRSIVYGLQADLLLDDRWAVGAGLSKVSTAGPQGANVPATLLVPLFANFYLSPYRSSWFVTGGLTWVTKAGDVKGHEAVLGTLRFSSFPLLPSLGLGYEIRQPGGFLFRLNLLAYLGENIAPSQGFSLGYAF